jgi:glucosylceramidase
MALVLVLVLGTATVVTAVARAGAAQHAPPGPRLSGPERRAITLRSLSVVNDPSRGLIVTATFDGDLERYMGQGGLRQALLALVLVPKASGSPTTGILDEGGGFAPERVRVSTRRGDRSATAVRTVDVYARERVLGVHAAGSLGVVRAGDRVIFALPGSARTGLAAIRLELFARSPAANGRVPSPGAWRRLLSTRPTATRSLTAGQIESGCAPLSALRSALAGVVGAQMQPELGRQQQARSVLMSTMNHTKASLGSTLASVRLRIARLQGQIKALQKLAQALATPIKVACAPPPPPPATTTTTTTPAPPPPAPSVQVVQTDAAQSQMMSPQPELTLSATPPQNVPVIDVDENARYQQFTGIGASMTDSSASLIYNKMSATQRAMLMQDLFGQPGSGTGLAAPPIHLNFLRVGVAATGAMTVTPAYSYDDNPPGGSDPNLTSFSIGHDTSYIIPALQQALQVNPELEILASPWSPPGWMKGNGSLNNRNNSGTLPTAEYATYAQYLVKFIQNYASAGIPIAALTPANEPTTATQYPGLNLSESQEAQFIAQDLKPALASAGLQTKIYGNDLSWDQYSGYASPLASDPSAGPDLSGIAWHCYFNSPTVMTQLHQQSPSLDQIVDECSPEIRPFGTPEYLISTLRNWASVVAIWSIALDPSGNPIQTPNSCGGCRGAVSIDQTTGDVTFRPEYYQLGQVSAFVQPGAIRVDSPNFVTYGVDSSSHFETISSGLDDVAFLNPDGSKVLVANNNSNSAISFAVQSDGRYFSYTIPAQGMTTFSWQ